MREPVRPPEFEPDIPQFLIEKLPESERWLYEQMSVQGQCSKWLVERSIKADEKRAELVADYRELKGHVEQLKAQVDALQLLRAILGAKWKVVVWMASALLVPIILAVAIAGLIKRWDLQ